MIYTNHDRMILKMRVPIFRGTTCMLCESLVNFFTADGQRQVDLFGDVNRIFRFKFRRKSTKCKWPIGMFG